MSKKLIAPSLLASDFANLQREIEMVNASEGDWFHVDVMDGVFVPNISFGQPVVKAIMAHTKKFVDVHLMITSPDRYVQDFADLGVDSITVHYEVCPHLHRTLQVIKNAGMKAGVAINPHTPASFLQDVIQDIELVNVMSVNPGFGGQTFIENTYRKVRELKELILNRNAGTLIEIDGGVSNKNAIELINSGADVLVAGSFIFKSENPTKTIADLKTLIK